MTATTQTSPREALTEPGIGERLREARDLIADRARWMMGSEACSADGTYVRASSPEAVAWCGLGAYRRVGGDRYDAVHNYLDAIARELYVEARTSDPDTLGGLVLVNDWLCWDEWIDDFEDPLEEAHERVLRIYDVAIGRYEGAGSSSGIGAPHS